jgi:uncharacterized damage-inducible protein DinB
MTTPGERRSEPSTLAGERDMLEGFLEYHRATLALKCEGLDDEQLRRRPVAPSGLSLLGLVRHMAEVECGWFREVLGGEPVPTLYCATDPDGDFHPAASDTYAEAYGTWQAQISLAREIAAARSLDDVSAGEKRETTTGQPYSLRWIYTHMIEEYARHNGHADLIREAIDGVTGE